MTAPDGTLSYVHDGALLTSTTWSGAVAGSVTRSYDSDFRLAALTVGNDAVTFAHDADGLLTRSGSMTLTRDALNGLQTGTALGQITTAQTHSTFGEVAFFAASFAGTPLYSTTFSRDKLGRITERTETIGGDATIHGYTYDLAGRLTDVSRNGALLSHYDYDANGNRTVRTGTGEPVTATYDAQDRLLTYGDLIYAYTAGGELAQKTQGAASVTYAYDELGNLRRVVLPTGITVDYVIDGHNRRVGKRINGELVQGSLYQDRLNPVAELDGAGELVARFVYGSRPNVPDYLVKGGSTYRIVSDHLGSPRLVVNVATGEVAQRMDFDEFGRVTLDTNPGFQPFGFAGGLLDRHTGLVRFGARDYDPEVGRWTAKDPVLFAGGDVNLYGYVVSDPVNWIDPAGLLKLPPNPQGLPPEWTHDPNHRHPGGDRFRGPGGDILDWHRGQPGRPGAQGHDHWHHYPGGKGPRHKPLMPGEDIPDPAAPGASCKTVDPVDVGAPAIRPGDIAIAIGIGIIVGTIIEDVMTGGVGMADDPATIGYGLSLILGGAR